MEEKLTEAQRLERIEKALFGDGTTDDPGLVKNVTRIMEILTKSTGGVAVLKAIIALSVALSAIVGTFISAYNIFHNMHGGK